MHFPVRIGPQPGHLIERRAIMKLEPLLSAPIGPSLPRRADELCQFRITRARTHGLAQIDTALGVQTQEPAAVRGQPAAIARATEWRRRRRDDPERRP